MADLTAIRQGLAANLAVLPDIQVSAKMMSNPTPPSIHVYPGGAAGDIEYHQAMRGGLERWPFTVQAFVGLVSDLGAQDRLDPYLASTGSSSVKQALETDRTLGGIVQDVNVVACTGYRPYVLERGSVLGAEWHVEVLATGS